VPFPTITKSAYDSLVRGNGADVNLEVKRLAQLKNLTAQAMMIAKALRGHYNPKTEGEPNSKMYQIMRQVEKNIEQAWTRVPLEIVNK